MRGAEVARKTNETDITLKLVIDGSGSAEIKTGCGFMDHMLTLFAFHGGFDLSILCKGDTHVDDHHTVEDIGIVLGKAFDSALGGRSGIARYGNFLLPMDEALVLCAVDISGRSHLNYDVEISKPKIGIFDTELIEEFMLAVTRSMGLTLHFKQLAGENAHHIAEAVFKGFGRALRAACAAGVNGTKGVPSSKGVL